MLIAMFSKYIQIYSDNNDGGKNVALAAVIETFFECVVEHAAREPKCWKFIEALLGNTKAKVEYKR